jgi:FkbM family methyltransferase
MISTVKKNILSSFVSDLRPDDVIYDIGANVGIYSAFGGQVLDDGYVVAFEPHPVAVPTLYRNLRSNCTDFQLFQLALSSGAGYGRMEVDFSTDANILATSGVNVRLEQLKDVINQSKIPAPSVVKVDVEGAEMDVLQGFGEIFEEIRAIYIEVHKNRGEEFNSNVEDIVDILDLHFDEVSEIGEQERGEGIQTHIRARS